MILTYSSKSTSIVGYLPHVKLLNIRTFFFVVCIFALCYSLLIFVILSEIIKKRNLCELFIIVIYLSCISLHQVISEQFRSFVLLYCPHQPSYFSSMQKKHIGLSCRMFSPSIMPHRIPSSFVSHSLQSAPSLPSSLLFLTYLSLASSYPHDKIPKTTYLLSDTQ